MINYYQILNVDEEAKWSEIQTAYLKLCTDHPEGTHFRNLIEEACDTLKDPAKKVRYFTDWPDIKELYQANKELHEHIQKAAEHIEKQTEFIRNARKNGNLRSC